MSVAVIAVSPFAPPLPQNELPAVLIMEDNRNFRWELIDRFKEIGIAPFTATTGHEAIRIASELRPDLLMLDGLVPTMHGVEVARFVRRIDTTYRPRIVIMTAIYKNMRYQNEAKLKYGVDQYLAKPIAPKTLFDLVRQTERIAS